MGTIANIAKLPFKAAALPFKGGAYAWKNTPKEVKTFAAVTAAIAATVGFLTYDAVRSRPHGTRLHDDNMDVAQIPPMLTPQDLMLQPMQAELSGPADGRAPGEWVARTRGSQQQQAAQQPTLDPSLKVSQI